MVMPEAKKHLGIHGEDAMEGEKNEGPHVLANENTPACISEEEITGEAANRLHELLQDRSPNPDREQMIKAAMSRFPRPGQPVSFEFEE
jgi:hypothetical protein